MKPTIITTNLKDLKIIDPVVFADFRGNLFETYHKDDYAAICSGFEIAQTYQSSSIKNVLRGLHFQDQTAPVAKIVRCTRGAVFDVAVDIRATSSTFGQWYSIELSEKNNLQLFIPVGFAHGFLTLSDRADVHYHQSGVYNPDADSCIIWNDDIIGIDWPIFDPILSEKDAQGISLREYQHNPAF